MLLLDVYVIKSWLIKYRLYWRGEFKVFSLFAHRQAAKKFEKCCRHLLLLFLRYGGNTAHRELVESKGLGSRSGTVVKLW